MGPDEIYATLRERIVWLELEPETVLNLTELAAFFGVSRTPVKEALIHLQAEGWLLRNGSQFMVTPLSLDRIRETTEIRSVLEVQANVWALHRILPEELASLKAIEREIIAAKPPLGVKEIVELDSRFHRTVYQAVKNNQLAQILDLLLSRYTRIWLSIPREIEPEAFFAEVKTIIKAIVTKDEEQVREATLAHIKKSVDEIAGYFSAG